MLQSQLIQARTQDGLVLPGVHLPAPQKRAVLIWVPGLGGAFTSHLARTEQLAKELGRQGVGLGVFNTRGSYTVAHLKTAYGKSHKRIAAGEAFERFADCVLDLDAMVRTMKQFGYRKIFLAGHSTGANKVAYYGARTKQKLAGTILLGPVSDIPTLRHELGSRFFPLVNRARAMVRQGRGDELLPARLAGTWFWSARRFISLAVPKQAEDTFPYYDAKRPFPWVKHWRTPLSVVLGGKDEFLDRPARAVLQAFDRQCTGLADYDSYLVPDAEHSFDSHSTSLARHLAQWVARHLP